ncbi:MAG: hypothetical protein AAFZ18_29085 [Myxococcota bacterium]
MFGPSVRSALALAMGVAGGLGLSLVLDAPSAPEPSERPAVPPNPPIRVEEASGLAWVDRAPLGPTRLRRGSELFRPAALGTTGASSRARLRLGDVDMELGDDARVIIGGRGNIAQLDYGRLRVAAPDWTFTTRVPARQLEAEGKNYTVTAFSGGVLLGIAEGAVRVVVAGQSHDLTGPSLHFVGAEVESAPLPAEHTVSILQVLKRGRGTRVWGQSSPFAQVKLRIAKAEGEAWADQSGRFVVDAPSRRGRPDLEAWDGLGRHARLDPVTASTPPPTDALIPASWTTPGATASGALTEASAGPRPGLRRLAKKAAAGTPAQAPTEGPGRRGGVPSTVDVTFDGRDAPVLVIEKKEVVPQSPDDDTL